MTNTTPTEQEMTDVFSRFSAPLPPLSQSADDRIKISDRKKAALATAAVLLGGGATFAAVNSGLLSNPFDSINDRTVGSDPLNPTKDSEDGKNVAPVTRGATSIVPNGVITPSDDIEIAQRVQPTMTFSEAYATAREEVGSGGIFSWRGEVYNTYTVEEWQGLSFGQRQEFLVQVGYRPTGQTQAHGPNGPELDTPDIYEFVINGRLAIGVDEDHDGTADAIIFLDEETNDLIAYVDIRGDDRIDSIYRYDSASAQVVGMQTIEEPFLVDVHRLEELSSTVYKPTDSNLSFVMNDDKTLDDNDDFDDDDDDYTDDSGYVNDAEMPEMD